MRITALKPGVTTEYGISVPVSTTVVVGDEYGKSLVLSLRAADTDGVLPPTPNTPFLSFPDIAPIGAAQQAPRNLIAKRRLVGVSGHDGSDTDTMLLTISSPADFDAVQIVLVSDQNSASNAFKVGIAPSAVFGNGWQPKDSQGANVPFTQVTFGTQDVRRFDNPNGGADSGKITNGTGSIANTNVVEGYVVSDWMPCKSLARSDIVTAGRRLLMVRVFGVGQGAINFGGLSASSPNSLPSTCEPDTFGGYWSGSDYSVTTPGGPPEGTDWMPTFEVKFLLRGGEVSEVKVVGCASESIESGYNGSAAVPQWGGGIDGWPRKYVAARDGSGKATSFVDMTYPGTPSRMFQSKALTSIYNGGLTHLLFKPWTVNDLTQGVPGVRDAIGRTSMILQACAENGVRPVLIWPYGGPGIGSTERNMVDAYLTGAVAQGYDVFDCRSLVTDSNGAIKTQYLTVNSGGGIVDDEHLNELGHNVIRDLFISQQARFGL